MKINRFLLLPLLILLSIGIFFLQTKSVFANEPLSETNTSIQNQEAVTVKLFWGVGCPHCKAAEQFLDSIQQNYSNLQIETFEVYYNQDNQILMQNEAKRLGVTIKGVPFIVIENEYITGYQSDSTTGKQLISIIDTQFEEKIAEITTEKIENSNQTEQKTNITDSVFIPVIGELKTSSLSLPIFTIIVAAIDGFNPCAMWTLLFLISLLLGMKDRRRMWLLGSVFIITSGLVYFLFLSAWLQFFSFFGYIRWLQVGIGLLAFGAGGYYLWDFWNTKNGGCHVSNTENHRKVFSKLKELTHKKQLILALVGIIGLAIAVNLVELICSAGLPAIYTQVLSLSNIPWWQYYLYLLLYIFIFMLDDLFIFFTAMITLKAIGVESKYSKFSHCVGGLLLLIIGILLVFKPELLMFG
jgi:thiol-disulfide isomerase/thioredoxin